MSGGEVYDPLDYQRRCIFERSQDLASFADMVAKLIQMGRDDKAHAMFLAVVEEQVALKLHFSDLARGLKDRDAADAAAQAKRVDQARDLAERAAAREAGDATVP